MTDLEQIEERVQRGAQLLDVKMVGWYRYVDKDVLDLSNSCRCVLGQLFGWFADGARSLRIRAEAADYGFESPNFGELSSTTVPIYQKYYQDLEDCWVKEINQRLECAGSIEDMD